MAGQRAELQHGKRGEKETVKKLYKSDIKLQFIAHIIMIILSLAALLPFVLLVICSFTDENYAIVNGFSFFPQEWSLSAYEYLVREWAQIGHAYMMSFVVMVTGTVLGVAFSTTLAYGLSRDIPGKRLLNLYVVLTMLFSGGVVSSYIIWSNYFHIKNTIFALILPNFLVGAFNVILIKNYFQGSIPESILESARIDGAGELKTFLSIVLPLSKPIMATVGLMTALTYWNDWNNGLYYIDDSQYYTLQLLLNQINENVTFLASNSSQILTVAGGTSALPTTTMRMAIAVIGILPIMVIYPFFQKYFVKGITVGSVKG